MYLVVWKCFFCNPTGTGWVRGCSMQRVAYKVTAGGWTTWAVVHRVLYTAGEQEEGHTSLEEQEGQCDICTMVVSYLLCCNWDLEAEAPKDVGVGARYLFSTALKVQVARYGSILMEPWFFSNAGLLKCVDRHGSLWQQTFVHVSNSSSVVLVMSNSHGIAWIMFV